MNDSSSTVDVRLLRSSWRSLMRKPQCVIVWLTLVHDVVSSGGRVSISVRAFARDADMEETALRRFLDALRDAGWISIEPGRRSSVISLANPPAEALPVAASVVRAREPEVDSAVAEAAEAFGPMVGPVRRPVVPSLPTAPPTVAARGAAKKPNGSQQAFPGFLPSPPDLGSGPPVPVVENADERETKDVSRRFVAVCQSKGFQAARAWSAIGKWRKAHDDVHVEAAMLSVLDDETLAADPLAFVFGSLKRAPRKGEGISGPLRGTGFGSRSVPLVPASRLTSDPKALGQTAGLAELSRKAAAKTNALNELFN
jgi:hypothetical protein